MEYPKQYIYINDWSGVINTHDKIRTAIDEAAYMNCDAVAFTVRSEYFEAVRDPLNHGSWETMASWNMLEEAIAYTHSKNMQFHAWVPINIANNTRRAERRLFGEDYCVVERNGNVYTARNDLAFSELFDYELNLIKFVAEEYPELDGIHLEEPYYPWRQSYSTAMRDRVYEKYGYDPLYMPEEDMKPVINTEMNLVLNEFFTSLRQVTRVANPNLQLSATGTYYYSGHTGLDPEYLAQNDLLDWYGAQIYQETIEVYEDRIDSFIQNVPGIPLAAIASIVPSADTNPAFLEQVSQTRTMGCDIVGIFTHYHRNRTIDGQTIMDGLHLITVNTGDETEMTYTEDITVTDNSDRIITVPVVVPQIAITFIDGADIPLGDKPVELFDMNGVLIYTTITDSFGVAIFTDVLHGHYSVTISGI